MDSRGPGGGRSGGRVEWVPKQANSASSLEPGAPPAVPASESATAISVRTAEEATLVTGRGRGRARGRGGRLAGGARFSGQPPLEPEAYMISPAAFLDNAEGRAVRGGRAALARGRGRGRSTGPRFPLELETFTPEQLAAHTSSVHKHCDFCNLWFYAVDEMWGHMNQQHYLCSICQAAGTPHLYFRDSDGLKQHYADAHHPCREGECGESGLVAFASEQDLKDHQLERHSSKMPRFKKWATDAF
eukprot:gene12540-12673_t